VLVVGSISVDYDPVGVSVVVVGLHTVLCLGALLETEAHLAFWGMGGNGSDRGGVDSISWIELDDGESCGLRRGDERS